MLKYLLIALTLLTSSAFAEDMLAADCRLLDTSGKMLATFPGKTCHFLDDGTVLSMGVKELRRFGPEGKILWEIPLRKLEKNSFSYAVRNKKILVLSSKEAELPFDPLAYLFQIYDLEGKLLHSIYSFELFGYEKALRVTDFGEGKKGRFFINSYQDAAYVLSSDLKKVVKRVRFEGTENHQVKNVLMTEEGSFLYLHLPGKVRDNPPTVTVQEYFPEKKKIVLRYPARPSPTFYFPYGGSLTITPESYVINHPLSGTYLVSRKTGMVQDYIIETHQSDLFRPPHTVQLLSKDKFFSRWKL